MEAVDVSYFLSLPEQQTFEKPLVDMTIAANKNTHFYVDDREHPKAWLFVRRNVEAVLVLAEGFETAEGFEKTVVDQAVDLFREHNAILIIANQQECLAYLKSEYSFGVVERSSFIYQGDTTLSPRLDDLDADLSLKHIDIALAQRLFDGVDPDFRIFWSSADEFIEAGGSGICLMDGDTIVSCAWSAYVSGKHVEIAIMTAEDHRQKGYAFHLSQAYIRLILAQDKTPWWGCHKSNVASHQLGLKLGFNVLDEYAWCFAG